MYACSKWLFHGCVRGVLRSWGLSHMHGRVAKRMVDRVGLSRLVCMGITDISDICQYICAISSKKAIVRTGCRDAMRDIVVESVDHLCFGRLQQTIVALLCSIKVMYVAGLQQGVTAKGVTAPVLGLGGYARGLERLFKMMITHLYLVFVTSSA